MAQRVEALTNKLGDLRSNPHGRKRESTTEKHPLTSTCTPWQSHAPTYMTPPPYMHAHAHIYTYIHKLQHYA